MSKSLRADGKHTVEVTCRKCSRRWMLLRGDGHEIYRHGVEFVALTLDSPESQRGADLFRDARARPKRAIRSKWRHVFYYNPWTDRITETPPTQVRVEDRAGEFRGYINVGESKFEDYGPRRYRVTCHKRCGRQEILSLDRLQNEYREAVQRHAAEVSL